VQRASPNNNSEDDEHTQRSMADVENGKRTEEGNDIIEFIKNIDEQKGKRNRAKTFQ